MHRGKGAWVSGLVSAGWGGGVGKNSLTTQLFHLSFTDSPQLAAAQFLLAAMRRQRKMVEEMRSKTNERQNTIK